MSKLTKRVRMEVLHRKFSLDTTGKLKHQEITKLKFSG